MILSLKKKQICTLWLLSFSFTSSSRSFPRKFFSLQWYSYISGGPTDFSVASNNSILDILANSPTFSYMKKEIGFILEVTIDFNDFTNVEHILFFSYNTWGRNWQRLLTWICRVLTSSSTSFWLQCLLFSIQTERLFSTWISLWITTLPSFLYLKWQKPVSFPSPRVIRVKKC